MSELKQKELQRIIDEYNSTNLHSDTKNKIDKWIIEFSARPHFIEDENLFDALYDCICWRVSEKDLSNYLQENQDKFVDGVNADLLICHAMDCYHAMQYLIWVQNGKLSRNNPMGY